MGVESPCRTCPAFAPVVYAGDCPHPRKPKTARDEPASPPLAVGLDRRNTRNDRQGGARAVRGRRRRPPLLADGPLSGASRPDLGRTGRQSKARAVYPGQPDTRRRLEEHCRALGLPMVAALDAVTVALRGQTRPGSGRTARAAAHDGRGLLRPGRRDPLYDRA